MFKCPMVTQVSLMVSVLMNSFDVPGCADNGLYVVELSCCVSA